MSNIVVVGSQWGDEGKGKITDLLSEESHIVVRYQGGCNAGHTVVKGENKYVFHLIPSGILHEGKKCFIGSGVVIDPGELLAEMDGLRKQGIGIEGKLFIDSKAHVVFPYHKMLDEKKEEKRGKNKIGTTKRGIGPTYLDKNARCGIRMSDLIDENVLEEKLKNNFKEKNENLKKIYNVDISAEEQISILNEYIEYGKKLKGNICDVSLLIHQAIERNEKILFEGAQGTLLDIDHGTYPYVTSSSPIAGGACTGVGVGPTKIDKVLGITKAYTTRVGEGPFPTEMLGEMGESIRKKGGEYGATTGRPRRCGWFDAVVVKYAVRVNGMESMVITKIDVLSGMEKLMICTGYQYNNEIMTDFPSNLKILKDCKPIYEEMDAWSEDISEITTYDKLPNQLKSYVAKIEKLTGAKVAIVSVGPKRSQTIIREKIFK